MPRIDINKALTVIVLVAIAICVAPSVCFSEDDSQPAPETSPTQSEPAMEDDLLKGLDYSLNEDSELTKGQLVRQFAISIFFVVILGICAWWLSKKMPRITNPKGKSISVVESINLGSKRSLHLLEISPGRRILIGSTNESIRLIAEVGHPGKLISQIPDGGEQC